MAKNNKNTLFIFIGIFIIFVLVVLFIIKTKNNKIEKFDNSLENYTAIIVEPREHESLELVLSNFMENLDYQWNFIIFHGNKNIDYINNIIETKLADHKNRITLVNLNVDNMTVEDYNGLFFKKEFYDYIPTEVFLVFQTDTIICEIHKDKINDFIKYDYVGAPWGSSWPTLENKVGNGGLSLRRKSKMLEILNTCNPDPRIHEDVVFSNNDPSCTIENINKPSAEESKNFSTETVYSDHAFGLHKSWVYNPDNNLYSHCKNYNKLVEFNN
jgi:hypothetical protein